MSKRSMIWIAVVLCISLLTLSACKPTSPDVPEEDAYYIGSNLNGYAVPGTDDAYKMNKVPNSDTLWYIEVDFSAELRDKTFDGHWYKVTDGTWDADGTWGTEAYELQPAPVKYDESGQAVGLGSIWIDKNGVVNIVFDAENKKIYDSSMSKELPPMVYGNIAAVTGGTDWGLTETDAIVMYDSNGDDLYTALVTMKAAPDGYTVAVATSMQYYIGAEGALYGWGAGTQYLFDGSTGGMGSLTTIIPDTDGDYLFTYHAKTHVTTMALSVEGDSVDLTAPVLYGDFNGWAIEGDSAHPFAKNSDGTWSADITLPAGEAQVALCVSKSNYGQYGWGAGEQYLLDGTAGGMGALSTIESASETTYTFTYDPATHITTHTAK